MSSFSICKVCSGSVFLCHILAPVWLASLPNQMLGKVATFLLRLAWLVTSFMLSICGQREAAHVGNKKKTKPVATEIHLERLWHSSCLIYPLPFSTHDLNLSPWATILEYASRTSILFGKKSVLLKEEPQDNTVQTWKSLPYHLGHFAQAALFEEAKFKASFWGNSSMSCPLIILEIISNVSETIGQVNLHFFKADNS